MTDSVSAISTTGTSGDASTIKSAKNSRFANHDFQFIPIKSRPEIIDNDGFIIPPEQNDFNDNLAYVNECNLREKLLVKPVLWKDLTCNRVKNEKLLRSVALIYPTQDYLHQLFIADSKRDKGEKIIHPDYKGILGLRQALYNIGDDAENEPETLSFRVYNKRGKKGKVGPPIPLEMVRCICSFCYYRANTSLKECIIASSNADMGNVKKHFASKHKDEFGGDDVPHLDEACYFLPHYHDVFPKATAPTPSKKKVQTRWAAKSRNDATSLAKLHIYECINDLGLSHTIVRHPSFRQMIDSVAAAGAVVSNPKKLYHSFHSLEKMRGEALLHSVQTVSLMIARVRTHFKAVTGNRIAFCTVLNDCCDARRYEVLGLCLSFIDPVHVEHYLIPVALFPCQTKIATEVAKQSQTLLARFCVGVNDLYTPMNDTATAAIATGSLITQSDRKSYCLMHQTELIMKHSLGIVERTRTVDGRKTVVDSFRDCEVIRKTFLNLAKAVCSGKNKSTWLKYQEYCSQNKFKEARRISIPNVTRVGGTATMYRDLILNMFSLKEFVFLNGTLDNGTKNRLQKLFPDEASWRQMAELYAIMEPMHTLAKVLQTNKPGGMAVSTLFMAQFLHETNVRRLPPSNEKDLYDEAYVHVIDTDTTSEKWNPSTPFDELPTLSLLYQDLDEIRNQELFAAAETHDAMDISEDPASGIQTITQPNEDPQLKLGAKRKYLSEMSCELLDRVIAEACHYFSYEDTDRNLSLTLHPLVAMSLEYFVTWKFMKEDEIKSSCWDLLTDEICKYYQHNENTQTNVTNSEPKQAAVEEAEDANDNAEDGIDKAAASEEVTAKPAPNSTSKKASKKRKRSRAGLKVLRQQISPQLPNQQKDLSKLNEEVYSNVNHEVTNYRTNLNDPTIENKCAHMMRHYGNEEYRKFFPEHSGYHFHNDYSLKQAISKAEKKYVEERSEIESMILEEEVIGLLDYFDPLLYWKKNKAQYPRIFTVACVVLAKPPTNAHQERIFSRIAWFEDVLKSRTLPKTLEIKCLESLMRPTISEMQEEFYENPAELTPGFFPEKDDPLYGKIMDPQFIREQFHSPDKALVTESSVAVNKTTEPFRQSGQTHQLGDIADTMADRNYLRQTYVDRLSVWEEQDIQVTRAIDNVTNNNVETEQTEATTNINSEAEDEFIGFDEEMFSEDDCSASDDEEVQSTLNWARQNIKGVGTDDPNEIEYMLTLGSQRPTNTSGAEHDGEDGASSSQDS